MGSNVVARSAGIGWKSPWARLALALAAATAAGSIGSPPAPTPTKAELSAARAATAVPSSGSAAIAGWQIQSSARVTDTGAAVSSPGYTSSTWYSVPARSTVMAGLMAAGVYPTNLLDGNNLQSVSAAQFAVPWWYRSDFTVDASTGPYTFLDVSGVTYQADLWVDGTQVANTGTIAGTWTSHTFDISSLVHSGTNALAFRVTPNDPNNDLTLGWIDWSPPPPDHNMGISRDVVIRRTGPISLTGPRVLTSLASNLSSAALTVKVDAQNNTASTVSAVVAGTIDAVSFQQTVSLGANQTSTVVFSPSSYPQLNMSQPRVWWPSGEGDQPMYQLTVDASVGGSQSDSAMTSFGIRSVQSSVDSSGGRTFTVNGKLVLIRGGGWASDIFLRYDYDRLDAEMRYVRDLGLNAVRLEGKLETDEFFQLADKYGIMVLPGWECCDKWQSWTGWSATDLQIATASAAAEARMLRNHPSVITFLIGSDMAPPANVQSAMGTAFSQNDWPNSIVNSAANAGGSGMHMDGPYDWVPPVYWYQQVEGGAYGFNSENSAGADIPTLESVQQELTSGDQSLLWQSPSTNQYHAGYLAPFQNFSLFDGALAKRYGGFTSLQDYVEKAQLQQYEAVRAQFEAHGRNFTSANAATGVIYWMLNNAWPSLHWNLFDYYLDQGGSYFGAKEANRPLHVQYSYDDASVVIVNQPLTSASGLTVTANVYNTDGTRKYTRTATNLSVGGAGASSKAFGIPAITGLTPAYFIELTLSDGTGQQVDRNVYWYSTTPDADNQIGQWYYAPQTQFATLSSLMSLPRASLSASAASTAQGQTSTTTVTLSNTGSTVAFFTRLSLRGSGSTRVLPVTWTDDDITLWPGESETVTASYSTSQLNGAAPHVAVSGVNVPAQDVSAAFAPSAPGVVTSVSAVANGGGAATVSWSPPASGSAPSYYAIYAYSYTGTAQMVVGSGPGSVVVTGLTPNAYYTFTALAYNQYGWGSGWSAWSPWMLST